jgi:hypothetical protein
MFSIFKQPLNKTSQLNIKNKSKRFFLIKNEESTSIYEHSSAVRNLKKCSPLAMDVGCSEI